PWFLSSVYSVVAVKSAGGGLCDQIFYNASLLGAGQALFESLKRKRQTLVIDAEKVKDRRVKIADVHRIFHDVIRKVVGLAVTDSRLHAAAGHPGREAAGMVVASVFVLLQTSL